MQNIFFIGRGSMKYIRAKIQFRSFTWKHWNPWVSLWQIQSYSQFHFSENSLTPSRYFHLLIFFHVASTAACTIKIWSVTMRFCLMCICWLNVTVAWEIYLNFTFEIAPLELVLQLLPCDNLDNPCKQRVQI